MKAIIGAVVAVIYFSLVCVSAVGGTFTLEYLNVLSSSEACLAGGFAFMLLFIAMTYSMVGRIFGKVL